MLEPNTLAPAPITVPVLSIVPMPVFEWSPKKVPTNCCPVLRTPVGTMEGTYEMHGPGGRVFRAAIPRFSLRKPGVMQ